MTVHQFWVQNCLIALNEHFFRKTIYVSWSRITNIQSFWTQNDWFAKNSFKKTIGKTRNLMFPFVFLIACIFHNLDFFFLKMKKKIFFSGQKKKHRLLPRSFNWKQVSPNPSFLKFMKHHIISKIAMPYV